MTSALVAASDDPVLRVFPNGLMWIHKPIHHNGISVARLMFPSGTAVEPAGEAGVTRLMTSLLFKGTKKKNALAFAQATEGMGVSLDAGAQEDYWEMSEQATTDRFDPFFDLFEEALFQPTFPEEEVKKERQAQVNAIRTNKESIFQVAHELLDSKLYPNHPYGRPEDGDETVVAGLTQKQVADRYRSALDPKGAVLVTVGDLPLDKLTKRVEALVKDWPAHGPAAPAVPPVKYPAGQVMAEELDPFEQSYLMMAWPAPVIGDPDYAAVKVLNAWLGAGMSSPLFMKVREEKGLAYEVASFSSSHRLGGSFVVYAGMSPANLEAAQARSEAVIAEAVKAPLSAEDLESAKRFIRGHFSMDHQTNGRQAWYLCYYQMMGQTWQYDKKYPEDIQKVTSDDVLRVAKKIFAHPPVIIRIRSNK